MVSDEAAVGRGCVSCDCRVHLLGGGGLLTEGGGAGLATGACPLGPVLEETFIEVAVNVVGVLDGAGQQKIVNYNSYSFVLFCFTVYS